MSDLPAGSSNTGEPAFLVVGKLRRPHGLQGELLMEVITDFPERLQPGVVVYIGEQFVPHTIRSCRAHGTALLLLGFTACQTPEEAGMLRNQLVYVRTADRPPLPPGEFYHHQLIGLQVRSEDDLAIGVVTAVLDYPAHDIYVVRTPQGREFLLPGVSEFIRAVDLEQKILRIHLIPGLLDEAG